MMCELIGCLIGKVGNCHQVICHQVIGSEVLGEKTLHLDFSSSAGIGQCSSPLCCCSWHICTCWSCCKCHVALVLVVYNKPWNQVVVSSIFVPFLPQVALVILILLFFFLKNIYIFFIGKAGLWEKERETDLSSVESLTKYLQWLELSQSIARSFCRVSHMDTGAQGFVLLSTAFPGHRLEAGLEVNQPGHEPMLIWGVVLEGGGWVSWTISPTPILFSLKCGF